MITEMGIPVPEIKSVRTPRQKFKSGIALVRSMVRMQRLSREWRKTRKLGDALKRAKTEALKRRESSNTSKKAVR